MARTRLEWIDVARGFALFLVVLLHVAPMLALRGFPMSSHITQADQILDCFRMPTLVMISGILAAGVREWSWRDALRRRIGPLMLLYVVWGAIIAVAMALLLAGTFGDAARDMLLMAVRPYIRVWYLFALAAYIALARALRSVPTAVVIPVAAVISVAAYAAWPAQGWPQGAESWLTVPQHWIFFVCAERGVKFYRALAAHTRPLLAVGMCALFASAGLLLWSLGLLEGASHPRSAVPALVLSLVGTLVTVTVFPLIGHWRAMGWARAMGRYSLGIYATHYVVGVAGVLAVAPHVREIRGPGVGLIVPLAVVVAVAAASYWLTRAIDRWAPVPLLRPWWDTTAQAAEPRGAVAQAQ